MIHRSARLLYAAALLLPSSLSAAEEPLQEIVVTADFRERRLAELPASATVLDAVEIESAALQHFEELIFAVPNLNWSGDGNRARYLQIRGVGELEQYEGAPNPSVGFLIDDIDFSGIGGIATLFDMQQVEVLMGPQGTRYGANALAGLVYARSAEPPEEAELHARLSAGGDNLMAGGIAAGGPVGGASYRLSLHRHESDGFRSNPYLGRDDTNGRSETTGRVKLHWRIGEHWSMRLAAMYVDIDDGYDAFALDNSLTTLSDTPGRDAQQSAGASLRATMDLGNGTTLTSITSVAHSDIDFSFDADWGNPESWAPFTYDYESSTNRERRTINQEFRLAGGSDGGPGWTAGIYGLALDEKLGTVNVGTYEDLVVYNFTDSLDDRFSSDFDALNLAAFGQIVVPVNRGGSLTAGIRVENRRTDYLDSAGLALDPGETMFGGEVAWSQALADDHNLYVLLSRGYKAGGFNLGLAPDDRREFGQEGLWNLETGIRSAMEDGRLLIEASVFKQWRDDQQVRTSLQLNPNDPASFVFLTDNAARGESIGLEASLRWLPADWIELYATLGLLDTEFVRFDDNPDLEGRGQAHAPSYDAALGATWRMTEGWFARIDLMARDKFYFDVSHDQESAAFERVNVRIGYETARWRVSVWGRNVFDEAYAVRGFYFGNEPPDFPATLYIRRGDPRQVGISFDFSLKE